MWLNSPSALRLKNTRFKNNPGYKFHNLMGQGNSTAGKAFALSSADLGSIFSIPYGSPQALPGVILSAEPAITPEHRW